MLITVFYTKDLQNYHLMKRSISDKVLAKISKIWMVNLEPNITNFLFKRNSSSLSTDSLQLEFLSSAFLLLLIKMNGEKMCLFNMSFHNTAANHQPHNLASALKFFPHPSAFVSTALLLLLYRRVTLRQDK
jgi:hypothetical protein